MNSALICITGKSTAEILLELLEINRFQGPNFREIRVSIQEGESEYVYDTIENLEAVMLENDIEGYIARKFNLKDKTFKTDGNCNIQVVDDPNRISSFEKHRHIKVRRNSNYTKPKNRKKK